jgi:hypothetical protein
VPFVDLGLKARTAGSEYGEQTLRVAELLERMSANAGREARPAVVWFFDPADDVAATGFDANVRRNEQVALALSAFRCYRVNVETIDSEAVRAEYARVLPAVHFFGPDNALLGRMEGKKAYSLAGFSGALESAWARSFTTPMKGYTRDMARVLDSLDKVDGRKQILARERARLAAKPDPRRERELAADEAKLKLEEEKVLAEEKRVRSEVALRPEYLKADETARAR